MSDKEPPEIFTASDVAFLQPPPSYEQVMGVYQTSVRQPEANQQSELPPLAYIDIMPRCLHMGNIKGKVPPKFDHFSAIMDGANKWLADNSGLMVWKCETVERKITQDQNGGLTYDLNQMLRHDATFGYLVFIRGLRLWLTKNPNPGSPPQQLGIRNVVPEKMTIEMPTRGYYRRGRVIVAGEESMIGRVHTFNTFEGLEGTIKRLKTKLQDDPIPGTILTIESDQVKAYDGFKKDLDPDASVWTEDKINFRRITQVIRIYYVKGPPAKEEIFLEDFVPEVTAAQEVLKPAKFEPFENIVQRLAHWVPANQGIRIVNIQQFDARIHKTFTDVSISSDSTDESVSNYGERRHARTLRVFYVKSSSQAAPIAANYVTSRVFLPARTGARNFESMIQTMDRIDAWLRVTGLPIYSVETVTFFLQESHREGADVHKADYSIQAMSGSRWLTGIRVYFGGTFQEPDPALLPPKPKFSGGGSSSCTIV